MAKRKRKADYAHEDSLMAFFIGMAVCILFWVSAESTYGDLVAGGMRIPWFPTWRMHMFFAFVGISVFILTLYSLEMMARKSREIAKRSALPWLPLAGSMALGVIVQLPVFAMIAAGLAYSVWAFRRMRSAR